MRKEFSARLKLARRIFERGYFFSRNLTRRHYFPTPATAQARQGQNEPDGRRGQTLTGAARDQNWPTVKATDALLLPTPTAHGNHNRKGASANSGDGLATAAKNWGTPVARDIRPGKGRDGQLPTQLLSLSGPGLPEEGATNISGKHAGSLNPAWVEQLMGWPPGTSSFTCSATGLSRWSLQWRLWLFGGN